MRSDKDSAGAGSKRGGNAVIALLLMLPMGLHLMENAFEEGLEWPLMLANLVFFFSITYVSWALLKKGRSRARWPALAGTVLYYAGSLLAMGVFAVHSAETRYGSGFRGSDIPNQVAAGAAIPDSIEVLFQGDKLWILGLPRIPGFMGRFIDIKEDRLFLGESNFAFMDTLLPRDFPAFAASKSSKPMSRQELREVFLKWQFPGHYHAVVQLEGDSGRYTASDYSTVGERGVYYVTPLFESRKAEYWSARFKSYGILLRDLFASPYHRTDLREDPYFQSWRESRKGPHAR